MPDDTQARPCCVTHAVEMARARMDAIQMHRDLWLTTGVQTQAREAHAAAWHVRRLANRHDCAGLCGAPEHAADGRDRG